MLPSLLRAQDGSASRYFAYAAAAIMVTAAIGAHGLAWLANSGQMPVVAFLPLDRKATPVVGPRDVDTTATGSVRSRADLQR
ncbi:MAG: hypothetical protein INR68_19370 [Methylobacterium mesophilicum]|nr:hypothetical protein [Methylobacterium mesophilicum]